MHVQTIFLIEKKATCFSELLLFWVVHKDFTKFVPSFADFSSSVWDQTEGIRFNGPLFSNNADVAQRKKKKHNWYIL